MTGGEGGDFEIETGRRRLAKLVGLTDDKLAQMGITGGKAAVDNVLKAYDKYASAKSAEAVGNDVSKAKRRELQAKGFGNVPVCEDEDSLVINTILNVDDTAQFDLSMPLHQCIISKFGRVWPSYTGGAQAVGDTCHASPQLAPQFWAPGGTADI